jgi:hypothetical protein
MLGWSIVSQIARPSDAAICFAPGQSFSSNYAQLAWFVRKSDADFPNPVGARRD